jgi:hypothetical protein
MILNPVQFDASDLTEIGAISAPGLVAGDWAGPRSAPIKGRAKDHYIREQNNRCCYCDEQWLTENKRVWDLEHVVPVSLHPAFMFEPINLAISCPDCNLAKTDKETLLDPSVFVYPTRSDAFAIVHPHFDEMRDHIKKRRLLFEPTTDKGTWTVKHCNLGRFAVKYIDPSDDSNPSDARFESAVDDLTADPATATAALQRITAYLTTLPQTPLP